MKFVAEVNGEVILSEGTVAILKEIILNSSEYKKNSYFHQEIQPTIVIERQEREKMKYELDEEKLRLDQ